MTCRPLSREYVAYAVLCGLFFSSSLAGGQTRSGVDETDRVPDLRGVWNFSTATPMQRPEDLADRVLLSPEETAQYEREIADRRRAGDSTSDSASLEARVSYEQAIWFERGDRLTASRTSLVVDPPDGRIPEVTEDAEQRAALRRESRGRHAWGPEDRGISERCLMGFNSGPPMTPSAYNNNMQLFQTGNTIAIVNEMVHNVRVIPLDSRSHLPSGLRQWVGDSRAHWEGETLAIETTNFLGETSLSGSSANLHLVERFTLVDRDTLLYDFTVTDPTTWSHPWTAQVEMTRSDYPLHEYACHEGNYSMPSSLRGARILEKEEAEGKAAEGKAIDPESR